MSENIDIYNQEQLSAKLQTIADNLAALQLQLDYERSKLITALGGEPIFTTPPNPPSQLQTIQGILRVSGPLGVGEADGNAGGISEDGALWGISADITGPIDAATAINFSGPDAAILETDEEGSLAIGVGSGSGRPKITVYGLDNPAAFDTLQGNINIAAGTDDGKIILSTAGVDRVIVDEAGIADFKNDVTVSGDLSVYDGTGTHGGITQAGAISGATAKIGAGSAIAGAAVQVDGGSVVVGDGAGGTVAKISSGGLISFPASTKTISSGAITATSTHTLVTCESGTTDDLTVINGYADGAIIFISPSTTGTTITIKNNAVGTGSIYTIGGGDVALTSRAHVAQLIYFTALNRWVMVSVKNT